jgi:ubiquinone/menaquinone biosynthesis C-methylase UbiE
LRDYSKIGMLKVQVVGKEWIDIVKKEFEHPAIVLWRAVELRQIEALVNKYALEKPILDLGCAEGKIASLFFSEKSVVGLDNCWDLIKENKKIQTYKALVMADACAMPYKNNAFGSIFSNCVIEHIPDLDKVLEESARVIKDKGAILFTVPSHNFGDFLLFSVFFNALGLSRLADWYKTKRNKLLNHFHCYDHNRWKGILGQNGFRLIE